MQILPPKWATRDSNSTLEMAPRTPIVCKGLRSSSNLKRKDAPLTLIISFIEKEKKIIFYVTNLPPLPLTLLLVPSCDKIQSVMLKKTRRFEVCKNLNQYVKKKRITKVYSTKQTKIVLIFWGDYSICAWCCEPILPMSRIESLKKKISWKQNAYTRAWRPLFYNDKFSFFFHTLFFCLLYFLLYFEVWDLLNLKCSY